MHLPTASPPDSDYDIDALRRALSARLVGRRIIHFDRIGSSMNETRKLADAGEPEGLVSIVEEQTAGRGRFNRAWISPRGQNISFSLLLRPALEQLPSMNMAATLAVADAVSRATGLETAIKWPNDVRIAGRKVSGILIETSPDGSDGTFAVIGIGVNVNFDPARYPEIADLSTSIYRETGKKASRTAVLRDILEGLDSLYASVKNGVLLTDRWASRLETLGRQVTVRWRDNVLDGLATAVDDQGNLILRQPDGSTVSVSAGEVTSQL